MCRYGCAGVCRDLRYLFAVHGVDTGLNLVVSFLERAGIAYFPLKFGPLGPKLRNKAVKGAHLCLRRTAVNALKLTEHAGERVLRLNRPAGDLLDKLAVGPAHRTRHHVDGCRDRFSELLPQLRSDENTSELQSLLRISYA